MNATIDDLKNRWIKFCHNIGLKITDFFVFENLIECYSEPHRHYHTTYHILDCLKKLDKIKVNSFFPTLTEGSIWFHDVIYDVKQNDNESKSADFAKACLINMGITDEYLLTNIPIFIRASTHKYKPFPLTELQLFLDIDLASLGYPPEIFKKNTIDIRKEYSFIPDDVFIKERGKILRTFMERPSIFYTEYFQKNFGEQARINLNSPVEI